MATTLKSISSQWTVVIGDLNPGGGGRFASATVVYEGTRRAKELERQALRRANNQTGIVTVRGREVRVTVAD